jgi:hypothetical protein
MAQLGFHAKVSDQGQPLVVLIMALSEPAGSGLLHRPLGL